MNTKTSILNSKPFICLAVLAACAVLSGPVKADSHEVTVKISVSAAGLDLSRPADAREVYRRLYFAARTACGNGNRVGPTARPMITQPPLREDGYWSRNRSQSSDSLYCAARARAQSPATQDS